MARSVAKPEQMTARPAKEHAAESAPASYVPDGQQPFDGAFGVRLKTTGPQAKGYRDYCIVREGLAVLIGDLHHSKAHREANFAEDMVKFHFRCSGESEIVREDGGLALVEPMTFGVLIEPAGSTKTEVFSSAQHEQSVTLLCERSFLATVCDDSNDHLPAPLQQFLEGVPSEFYYLTTLMRPEMAEAARALVESSYTGSMLRLHVEAKALDLVCQSMQLLAEMARDSRVGPPLRTEDLRRVTDICAILDQCLADPPSVSEFAQMMGWNENQLTRTFRQAVGMTVTAYLQRARMEAAYQKLASTGQTVTEVALDVGYEYANNFTTAFRRYFGVTPKQVRQGQSPRTS